MNQVYRHIHTHRDAQSHTPSTYTAHKVLGLMNECKLWIQMAVCESKKWVHNSQ